MSQKCILICSHIVTQIFILIHTLSSETPLIYTRKIVKNYSQENVQGINNMDIECKLLVLTE